MKSTRFKKRLDRFVAKWQRNPRWEMEMLRWRIEEAGKRRVGYAAISSWVDCDGMRGSTVDWCWTLTGAASALCDQYDAAEGPGGGGVYTAREGRQWEADYVPDTRDRYAEAAGF